MKGHVAEVVAGKKYRVFIYEGRDPLTRKKRYRTQTVAGTRKQAESALHRLASDVSAGKHATVSGTFGDLVEQWFTMMSPDWSPTTVLATRHIINGKLSGLADVRLDKLTPPFLDAFYSRLRAAGGVGGRPLSAATVRRIHVVVRASLEQAVRWGWLLHNPAQRAYTGKVTPPVKKVPSAANVAALLRGAAEFDPDLGALLTIEAHCGARRGELLALRWSDFDAGQSTLSVSKTIVHGPDGVGEKATTKTDKARLVVLAPESVAVLLAHRKRVEERALMVEVVVGADAYIFSADIEGVKPRWPSTASRALRTLCDKLQIESISMRDMRRFVASAMVTGGVDITTETEMLGHGATVALTHYTRSDRAALQRASRVVVDSLSRAQADLAALDKGR